MAEIQSDQALTVLEQTLPSFSGSLTVADAAAASGLSLFDAEQALEILMNRYVCRLQVTESGEVLFNFGTSLRRRGKKSLAEHLQTMGDLLWRGLKAGFKVWITVTLIVYFIVYVLIILALIFYSRDEDGIFSFSWIGDLFADLFWFAPRNMAVVYATDGDGYRHRSYQQRKRKKKQDLEKKKRFVQSVYDFVFSPPRPAFDPFADEKEVAAWLREQRGMLTMTEIVALAGWTYDQASERMADYLTRFNGEARITDDGVLIGRFDRMLMSGDGEMEGGKVELFWDEYEAPYQQTGNTSGRNAAIIGLNAFNLLISSALMLSPYLMSDFAYVFEEFGIPGDFAGLFLGVLPMIFSLLFFLIPILRAPVVSRREAQRKARNRKRRILREIFARPDKPFTVEQMLNRVNTGSKQPISEAEMEKLLQAVASEYGGNTTLGEDGRVLYRFERVAHEEKVAARERNEHRLLADRGEVIFDTAPKPLPHKGA